MATIKSRSIVKKRFNSHIDRIRRAIQQESISPTDEGIHEMAELTKDMLTEIGAQVSVHPTDGNPIVMGTLDVGAEKTILVYGMYDVMPAHEASWTVDPFAGEIKQLPGFGDCIVARGATNTKGPLVGFINAVDAMVEVGDLRTNLLFLIEGEEELGSPSLPSFVAEHSENLSQCDAMVFPFFSQTDGKTPDIWLGTKGIVRLELVCEGGEWGGPVGREIHASKAAWVASPVWKMISALATMMSDDEQITIDGLLDEVRPPSLQERGMIKDLAGRLDLDQVMDALGIKKFKYDKPREDLLTHYICDPSVNIMGIQGGYTGSGTKTILPEKIRATMDIRLVPDMTVDATVDRVREHLDNHGFGDVIQVRSLSKGNPWSQVELDAEIVQAAITTYRGFGYEPLVQPRIVGSGPFHLFSSFLDVPFIIFGLGHGSRQHSSDEYATLEGIKQFELSIIDLFRNYQGG